MGRAGVADEVGDGLQGHAAVTHDRHERVTELVGRPVLTDARLTGDHPERSPDVCSVERIAGAGAEDQAATHPLPSLRATGPAFRNCRGRTAFNELRSRP